MYFLEDFSSFFTCFNMLYCCFSLKKKACFVCGSEEWELTPHSFFPSFPCLNNIDHDGNEIKSDSNINEILLISGILTYNN